MCQRILSSLVGVFIALRTLQYNSLALFFCDLSECKKEENVIYVLRDIKKIKIMQKQSLSFVAASF